MVTTMVPDPIENLRHSIANASFNRSINGSEAVIRWQIPATGDFELTPEAARELADWLDENEDEHWLGFILLEQDPAAVAQHLRDEADLAETNAEESRKRAEEMNG